MIQDSPLGKLLIKHEGIRLKPYYDTNGFLTVGIGRNLETNGILVSEAYDMLANDVVCITNQLVAAFPWFSNLNEARKAVVISMAFNLGFNSFSKFTDTIDALSKQDYNLCAKCMLDSKWAKQVGQRADELSDIMLTGEINAAT